MMIQQRLDDAELNEKNVLKTFFWQWISMTPLGNVRFSYTTLVRQHSTYLKLCQTLEMRKIIKRPWNVSPSTLPHSAMLNMKSICFVKLVNNRKKHWINLQHDYDDLPHFVNSRLLIKKSNRKSFSAAPHLVCVGVLFVN